MPYKDKEIEKLYYSIGEVAQMFNVNTSLIRYYENEFEILHPARNIKGTRFFTTTDIENFRLIFHLISERGFTLNGAKKVLENNRDGVKYEFEVRETLTKVKAFLEELKSRL